MLDAKCYMQNATCKISIYNNIWKYIKLKKIVENSIKIIFFWPLPSWPLIVSNLCLNTPTVTSRLTVIWKCEGCQTGNGIAHEVCDIASTRILMLSEAVLSCRPYWIPSYLTVPLAPFENIFKIQQRSFICHFKIMFVALRT